MKECWARNIAGCQTEAGYLLGKQRVGDDQHRERKSCGQHLKLIVEFACEELTTGRVTAFWVEKI